MNEYDKYISEQEPVKIVESLHDGLMHISWGSVPALAARICFGESMSFSRFLRISADHSRKFNYDSEETCALVHHIADLYDALQDHIAQDKLFEETNKKIEDAMALLKELEDEDTKLKIKENELRNQ
jgi:hypothetical protein